MISAEASLEYGEFFIPEDGKNRLVIVTIEYTYLSQGRAEFSPESVVLMNTSILGYVGWAKTADLYQAEGSSRIVDLDEESLTDYVDSGETKTEVFVWEFPRNYTDFRLFFPEAEAIDITLSR